MAYQVLNKDFAEVHVLELPVEQSKVSCIAFNDRNHQLVTGGLGGVKVIDHYFCCMLITMVTIWCRHLNTVNNK